MSFEQYLIDCLDSNYQVDVIYTDFVKAFDRVSLDVLSLRLEQFGINGSLLKWLNDYLRNRVQYVQIGNSKSEIVSVPSGCPQGGHLSPFLFSAFVNPVAKVFRDAGIRFWLFADDIKYAKQIANFHDCVALQNVTNLFYEWCRSSGLELNVSKCNLMSFTRKRTSILYDYKIADETLARQQVVKDLGVYFDPKLSFTVHIETTCNKALKMLGFVKRHSNDFCANTVKLLFLTLVRPILEYDTPVWRPFYQNRIQQIEGIQRKFIRYMCFKAQIIRDDFTYAELLLTFDLNSLEERREMIDVVTLCKILNGSIDSSDLLSKISFSANNRTRMREFFSVPFHSTNLGKMNGTTRLMKVTNKYFDSSLDVNFHTVPQVKSLVLRNVAIDL